ncbi:hypothetical protein CKY47_22395 [Saccharothrix yanglingensis]|uniref:alcohol dehydrogenase n=1 Tax=Saccharothrix yanglingensis TaxID=659496 RepID=A0ABU0X3W7_9PSEU|nr:hypothetical protein [Saccharothrix yanglingensis]
MKTVRGTTRGVIVRTAAVTELGAPPEVRDVPVPRPGTRQVLVRLESSGICHTDTHAANGDWPVKPTPPFVPGHEGVGTVDAVGDGVGPALLGTRVAIPWLGTPAASAPTARPAGRRCASSSTTSAPASACAPIPGSPPASPSPPPCDCSSPTPPFMNTRFRTAPIDWQDWALAAAIATVAYAVVEAEKWWRRNRTHQRRPPPSGRAHRPPPPPRADRGTAFAEVSAHTGAPKSTWNGRGPPGDTTNRSTAPDGGPVSGARGGTRRQPARPVRRLSLVDRRAAVRTAPPAHSSRGAVRGRTRCVISSGTCSGGRTAGSPWVASGVEPTSRGDLSWPLPRCASWPVSTRTALWSNCCSTTSVRPRRVTTSSCTTGAVRSST